MNMNAIPSQKPFVQPGRSAHALIKLWKTIDRMIMDLDIVLDSEQATDELSEKSQALVERRSRVARSLLITPATSLDQVLAKLQIWESAYGPNVGETLETGWDIYRLMVISAMKDLQVFISE